MYLGFPNRSDCDRARELASRSLDGDLAEFDLGSLRAHLQECAACAEVAAAMGEITERVRTAVPMDPAPADVVAHMHVQAQAIDIRAERQLRRRPARRTRHRIAATAVAITAAAAAAGAGALVASQGHRTTAQVKQPTTLAELAPLDHQFRSIREGKLLLVLPPPRVHSPHVRSVLV
ncbi:MAG TPA: zf-HC2 domain-containing protein [Gaiellales bacterium]|nr:zf-HC2 domain-containing protein [Gaiellales bacterium]